MAYLGIDLGTSGLRALLVDDAGRPLASVERALSTQHPHPGWSEQDPATWIAALEAAVAELRDTAPDFAAIRGIGVAGHMHGATLLDASDQVIRPCILWNDTRSHAEAAALDATPGLRELSGNIVFPGFTAPKLAWVRAHEPDLFARVAKVLGADDYLSIQLVKPGAGDPVNLFMAWYDDQSDGGVHSPEVCLPGAGWEIAWLERTDITAEMGADKPFEINRAIIQKGETRMMVYYWFQQRDRRLAWDFAAKFWLMVDGLTQGRTDGAIVRLTTPIDRQETDDHAEARLKDMLRVLQDPLPRFVPNE